MKRLTLLLLCTISYITTLPAQVSDKKFNKYTWTISKGLESDPNNKKAIEKPIEDILWHGDVDQCYWLAQQLGLINPYVLNNKTIYTYYSWFRLLTERLIRFNPDLVALQDGRYSKYISYYSTLNIYDEMLEMQALLVEVSNIVNQKNIVKVNPALGSLVEEQWRVRAHYIESVLYGDDRYSTRTFGNGMDSTMIYKIADAIGDSSFIKKPYLLAQLVKNLPVSRENAYLSVQREVVYYCMYYLSQVDKSECTSKLTLIAYNQGKTAESSQGTIQVLAELFPIQVNNWQGSLSAIDMNNQQSVPLMYEFIKYRQQLIDEGHDFAKDPPLYHLELYGTDSLYDKYTDLYVRVSYELLEEMSSIDFQTSFKLYGSTLNILLEAFGYGDESQDWRARFSFFVGDLLETTMTLYFWEPSSWEIGAIVLETNILTQVREYCPNDDAVYEIMRAVPFFYGVLYNEEYAKYLLDTYVLSWLPYLNLMKSRIDHCFYMEFYSTVLQALFLYEEPRRSELQAYYSTKLEKALRRYDCDNRELLTGVIDYYCNNVRDYDKTQYYLDKLLQVTGDTLLVYSYNFLINSGTIKEDYERAAYYLDLMNREDSSTAAGNYYYSGLLPAYTYARVNQREKVEQQLHVFNNYIRRQFSKMLLSLGSTEASNQLKRYSAIDNCLAQTCKEAFPPEIKNAFVAEFYNWQLFSKGLLLALSNESRYILLNHPSKHVRRLYQTVTDLETKLSTMVNRETMEAQLLQNDIDKSRKNLLKMVQMYIDENGVGNLNVTDWTDVRDVLGDNEVAIEFAKGTLNKDDETSKELFVDDEYPTYYALMLRRGYAAPEAVRLFREDSLRLLIEGKNENQIYNNDSLNKAVAHLIVDSLLPRLKPKESVYFSPTGMLHQIAFENMYLQPEDLLSTHYDWHRLSSTRQLTMREQSVKSRAADSVMLYGGITYDADTMTIARESAFYPEQAIAMRAMSKEDINRGKAGPLPGTLEEIQAIKRQLDSAKKKSSVRQGTQANEESFKALSDSSFAVLHIATHGFFWEKDSAAQYAFFKNGITEEQVLREIEPMRRCGLLLSGANIALSGQASQLPAGVQDGVLTAQEISLLDLSKTQLVILSACETGVGEINSDGVFGLQRAFKKAGVETLIMSLWKVGDAATKLLMTEFYKHWLRGEDRHTAFRNAQQAVREKFEEPTYWAGFIILD